MSKHAEMRLVRPDPTPPPLLAGPPIPLPAFFGGDWAGATVCYDLDHVLEWQYTDADLIADLAAEQRALDAERAAGFADDAAAAAFNQRQRALNGRVAARRACYLVASLQGPTVTGPRRGDLAAWEAVSWFVLRWIGKEGLQLAAEQIAAPFFGTGSPPSAATGA